MNVDHKADTICAVHVEEEEKIFKLWPAKCTEWLESQFARLLIMQMGIVCLSFCLSEYTIITDAVPLP